MSNPIASIPTEHLTHEYWRRSKERAVLEREWDIVDHQRLPCLAEITKWFTGSHASAETKARTSREYQEFLTRRADVKEQLTLARARVHALDLEMKLRINKSFQNRSEHGAGHLVT